MLRFGTKYKEVIVGALFGAGASLIDVAMHVSMQDGDFFDKLIHPGPVMATYRILLLASGVGFGVLLWLNNRRERDTRQLSASFNSFRRSITGPATLLHANLQVLLMQYGNRLPDDTLAVIREAYEYSNTVQRALIGAARLRQSSARRDSSSHLQSTSDLRPMRPM